MSFDVFLRGFEAGNAAPRDGAAAMAVLTPLIIERDAHGFARIQMHDGTADVYGIDTPDDGFMFNQVGGRAAWDVIYAVAKTAGFVVMPVGCGTFLVDESLRPELPQGAPAPVEVIVSGADLLAAIETAP